MNYFIIFSAIIWDRILGEPPVKLHPTVWMGNYIKSVWKLKKKRSPLTDFIWGGFLLTTGILLFSLPLYYFFKIIGNWSLILNILISIPLLKFSFSIRYLLQAASEINESLKKGELEEARRLCAYHLVSRDTSNLTEEEVISAAIESVAENITDSFISPLFFFLLFGVPGAWAYRFINTGDAMIAYRTDEFEWGGKLTAWTDSFLNLLPARITAFGIVMASLLLPAYSGRKSWRTLKECHRKTASPNAGWTMSAMAGALNVTLEKKGEYILKGGEIPLRTATIESCLKLTVVSLILTMLFLILVIQGGLWVLNTAV